MATNEEHIRYCRVVENYITMATVVLTVQPGDMHVLDYNVPDCSASVTVILHSHYIDVFLTLELESKTVKHRCYGDKFLCDQQTVRLEIMLPYKISSVIVRLVK